MEECLNEYLKLEPKHDEAHGPELVPDQVKKACIVSNTPKPLKADLQLGSRRIM